MFEDRNDERIVHRDPCELPAESEEVQEEFEVVFRMNRSLFYSTNFDGFSSISSDFDQSVVNLFYVVDEYSLRFPVVV